MSNYTEETANELADKALAEAEAVGDPKVVDQINELLGASSQSLQEAYSTAIRVRRAEVRAREVLAASAIKRGLSAEEAAKLVAKTTNTSAPAPIVQAPAVKAPVAVQPSSEPAQEAADAEEEKPKRKGW